MRETICPACAATLETGKCPVGCYVLSAICRAFFIVPERERRKLAERGRPWPRRCPRCRAARRHLDESQREAAS